MAAYVKLFRSIWNDEDFRALPGSAQRLYMLLMSQQQVSPCGVVPLTPGRWAGLASDTDADSVRGDINRLTATRFIVVDPETEEVWIRTYVKHDEGFKVPNIKIALRRSLATVMSMPIRQALTTVLQSVGVTLDETVDVSNGESQQPAASSQQLATCSQQPAAAPSTNGSTKGQPLNELPGAAAAALEALLQHRLIADSPRKPVGYERSLRIGLPHDHGAALIAALQANPDATPLQLATDVLHMRPKDAAAHLENASKA